MIHQLMKTTTGHELLNFMDAYSGYNQINMHPPDEDKTDFTTGRRVYCYKVMSFELKNAGATFQRMVNKVFKDLIGSTMKVYVDNMLVKSIQRTDHLQYLDKAFDLLRQYKVSSTPKVHIWWGLRKILGIYGHPTGHRGRPRLDICNS